MISGLLSFGVGLLVAYFALMALVQVVLMAYASIEIRRVMRSRALAGTRTALRSPFSPTVSILVPAHDEETMIVETIGSLLAIEYPGIELVVINDGSTDSTMDALAERFDLAPVPSVDAGALESISVRARYRSRTHPRLVVLDKERGGKASALNAGLVHASGQLVCAVDADTILEPDAIERLVQPFLQDRSTLGAGGSVRPVNGCRFRHGRVVERRLPPGLLAAVQSVEYARAFLFGRLGWNRLGGNVIISGAFGLFDREAVVEAGGYLETTVGEDIELVLRLRRWAIERGRPDRISFLPEPMAWTEVPDSLRTLARQRNRWHRGLLDTLWRHRRVIGRPRFGLMGTLVIPYQVFEAVSPIMELGGLIVVAVAVGTGDVAPTTVATLLILAYGITIAISAVAVTFEDRLDHDSPMASGRVRRLGHLVAEQLCYRPLTMLWRLWGIIGWLRRDREWGTQTRRGLDVSFEGPPAIVEVEPSGR